MASASITVVLVLLLTVSQAAATQTLLTGTSAGMRYRVEKVAGSLDAPWGMVFVGQNQLMVTEKRGRISILDPETGAIRPIRDTVSVQNRGQGGLLDIAVPPDYQPGGWVYFTLSKSLGNTATTALARGRFEVDRIAEWQELLVTRAASTADEHFGSRIAFDGHGHLFMSIGDRGDRTNGQKLDTHAGKILRLRLDGTVPADNPFVQGDGLAEIWSYGHRNPQGLVYDAARQRLWEAEHGQRGGDEINLIERGANYGWPVVSHSMEYWGPFAVGEATHKDGMVDPIKVFTPAIAPGSLLLYNGTAFALWRGNLFIPSLVRRHLNRIVLDESGAPIEEERLLQDFNERMRDVVESPEGWLYVCTDSGNIYRIRPLVADTGTSGHR